MVWGFEREARDAAAANTAATAAAAAAAGEFAVSAEFAHSRFRPNSRIRGFGRIREFAVSVAAPAAAAGGGGGGFTWPARAPRSCSCTRWRASTPTWSACRRSTIFNTIIYIIMNFSKHFYNIAGLRRRRGLPAGGGRYLALATALLPPLSYWRSRGG